MKISNMKCELRDLIPEHSVLISDIQFVDLIRYQHYLDDLHFEIFHHVVPKYSKTDFKMKTNAVQLVDNIAKLNSYIKSAAYLTSAIKLNWQINGWVISPPLAVHKLEWFPVVDGYISSVSNARHMKKRIEQVIQNRDKLISTNQIKRVYFIGEPRLSQLKMAWPKKAGIEIVVIPDGNLIPEHFVDKLLTEKKQDLEDSLVVVCFSMKSHVMVQSVSSCVNHEPCKYVLYKHISNEDITRNMNKMVGCICNDVKSRNLSCTLAFSPILPVNFFNYRSVVAKRHFNKFDHNVSLELPGDAASDRETKQMIQEINSMEKCLHTVCCKYKVGFLNIPGQVLIGDSEISLQMSSKLINGLNLDNKMAERIVNFTFKYLQHFACKSPKMSVSSHGAENKITDLFPKSNVQSKFMYDCEQESSHFYVPKIFEPKFKYSSQPQEKQRPHSPRKFGSRSPKHDRSRSPYKVQMQSLAKDYYLHSSEIAISPQHNRSQNRYGSSSRRRSPSPSYNFSTKNKRPHSPHYHGISSRISPERGRSAKSSRTSKEKKKSYSYSRSRSRSHGRSTLKQIAGPNQIQQSNSRYFC